MKFLCPACDRLAEIDAFRIEGGALRLRCGKCGVESTHPATTPSASPVKPAFAPAPARAPAAPPGPLVAPSPTPAEPKVVLLRAASADGATMPAAADNPFQAPPGFCPKCIAPRGTGSACPQCGLVYLVFKESEALPPAPVAEAFRTLLTQWQDGAAHDQFLRQAMMLGALPAAARLYRIQLAYNPEDPFAARGREEVVRLATAAHPLTPSPRPTVSSQAIKPWKVVAALAGLILFVLALVSILRGVVPVGP